MKNLIKKTELGKIIRIYILTFFTVFCLSFAASGIITAKQRTDYNTEKKSYAVMSMRKQKEGIEIKINKKSMKLLFKTEKNSKSNSEILYYTPLGNVIYFMESAEDFCNKLTTTG